MISKAEPRKTLHRILLKISLRLLQRNNLRCPKKQLRQVRTSEDAGAPLGAQIGLRIKAPLAVPISQRINLQANAPMSVLMNGPTNGLISAPNRAEKKMPNPREPTIATQIGDGTQTAMMGQR
jgi:hypothetical protein